MLDPGTEECLGIIVGSGLVGRGVSPGAGFEVTKDSLSSVPCFLEIELPCCSSSLPPGLCSATIDQLKPKPN